MPELPEVQTMVTDLNRRVRGRVIRDVVIHVPKLVSPTSSAEFRRRLRGKTFTGFKRRGKCILASLARPVTEVRRPISSVRHPTSDVLVWHMRMTGHPLFRDERRETANDRAFFADPRNAHVRLIFRFADGTRLDYADVRKFGTLHLLSPQQLPQHSFLKHLGPDALDPSWTARMLRTYLRSSRRAIKTVLLDQHVIAGIGNIYADEILWAAKMHPLRNTATLTREECRRLLRSIRSVLRAAVRARGTSVDDFRDLGGRKGTYGESRKAYKRGGLPCFRCRTPLATLVVGGRGTHLCPRCQRRSPIPRP